MQKQNFGQRSDKYQRSDRWCSRCKKDNHSEENCYTFGEEIHHGVEFARKTIIMKMCVISGIKENKTMEASKL